ncbi:MAG: helix-turn-helix domain-containing protein [Planctomycetes bacterium]|nr:helix-turn-helix domain-containing protein [Planctomycetota bacterium]
MNSRARRSSTPELPADFADLPRVLTVGAVCDFLDVRERSVRRWIADGVLRCIRAGRRVRVLRSDLASFVSREGAK